MKRSFKVKALVLTMVLTMILGTSTNVLAAAEKFSNESSNPSGKANADILASFTASKTVLSPGETFTVSFDIDKMPSAGLGICSVSTSLIYDASKLEVTLAEKYSPYEPDSALCNRGPIGIGLNMGDAATLAKDDGDLYSIRIGGAAQPSFRCPKTTGNVMSYEFKVKEDAPGGKVTMYLQNGKGVKENGMTIDAVGIKADTQLPTVDDTQEFYIDYSTLDALTINVPATGITYTGDTVELDTKDNKSKDVTALVLPTPSNTSDVISWIPSDPSICTVADGVITAVGAGKTTVKAKIGAYEVSIPVNVTLALEGIEVSESTLSLDKATQPTASIKDMVKAKPAGAALGTVTYESDDTSVVTVDANGNVTAVGKGSAIITIKAGEYTTQLPVVVGSTLKAVSFSKTTLALDTKDNKNYDLKTIMTLDPVDADVLSKSFTSSNTSVATVDEDGNVTAVGNGTTTITATVNGKTATITVNVTVPLEAIDVNNNTVTVYKNDTDNSVKVTASPAGAAWTDLTAEVTTGSDCATATVSNDGVVTVTGVKAGNAVVTIKANNNDSITKTINVTVKENKVKEVTVAPENAAELFKGETKAMTATPVATETDHRITDDVSTTAWDSTNKTVATVDGNGVVTALKAGTTTIKATIAGVEGTYELTVLENPIVNVTISSNVSGNFFINDTMKLTATPVAERADHDTTDDTTKHWESSDTTVATVDDNGNVKGLKEGNATITCTIGSKSATYAVEVKANPIANVTIESNVTGNFFINDTMTLTATPVAKYPEHDTTDDTTKKWVSSDTTVATVDGNGNVKGVKEGNAQITCTIGSKSATYDVEVKANPIETITIESNKTGYFLLKETMKLTATPVAKYPEHKTTDDTTTKWVSSDTSVATVDDDGNVTALKAGITTITATIGSKSETYEVEVKENKITGVTIKNTGSTEALVKNQTIDLNEEYTVELEGYDPTDDVVINWTSDDETVATVDENGVVKALKEGVTIINLDVNGMKAHLQVSVTEVHIEGLDITEESSEALKKAINEGTLEEGSKFELDFEIKPATTTDDLETILDMIEIEADEEMLDYEIVFAEDGSATGKIVLHFKKAGETSLKISYVTDDEEDERPAIFEAELTIVEPKVEEPVEENTPDTGDMPVVAMTIVMLVSVAGIVVTRKELLK